MLGSRVLVPITAIALLLSSSAPSAVRAEAASTRTYIVVFSATQSRDGSYQLGGDYGANATAALALVNSAGGTVTADLGRQIAVLIVDSANSAFADTVRASTLVAEVGEDFAWKQFPSLQEALDDDALIIIGDPLEAFQWNMAMIRAPQARTHQSGQSAVTVGILDTGIDGLHQDFDAGGTNVDCDAGRDFIPAGPGVGVSPDPCVDNNFHGTHVAGIVAARQNGHGVIGVAPNVTLVPVKVCDAAGFCYARSVVAGITYAGDARFDVINMSFFMDDDSLAASTEFKCNSDPAQRAFRRAGERAIQYARNRGVTPVAALGNSDTDLAKNNCDTVPAESAGVIGTGALGRMGQKASYSSYGTGATDVVAPGGSGQNANCTNTVISTVPGNLWGCFQGTSMASPHSAGVAALIVSQLGVDISPTKVEARLQATAVDIGLRGYDECFGNGRIDALRAVLGDTKAAYDASAPFCPEYNE